VEEPASLLRDDRIAAKPVAPAAARPVHHSPPAATAVTSAPTGSPTSAAPVTRDDKGAPDVDADASHETVVITLGGGRYGIPMDAVDEVGRPPSVTRVPGLPAWLAGVANWRGRILAVVDLRPLLGAPQSPLGRNGRLVVCTMAAVTIGLVTEDVEGVVTVERDATEQPLVTLAGQAAALIAGQVWHARGPIALLDLDAVFALRTQLPRARRAG
jgi:purine-binding chemotaxis protein CheW